MNITNIFLIILLMIALAYIANELNAPSSLPPCTQLPTTSTPVRDRPNGKQMLFTVFACPDSDGITLRGAYVILEGEE